MKILPKLAFHLLVVAILALGSTSSGWTQTTSDAMQLGKKKGSTTVSSDNFRLNLAKKEGVFTGNVVLKDSKFLLSADRMVVSFADDNTVSGIVATGEVAIRQGGRATTSRQAEYVVKDKKLILTGDPVVMQNQNRIAGTVITIYPEEDRMDVTGGRSTVQIFLD